VTAHDQTDEVNNLERTSPLVPGRSQTNNEQCETTLEVGLPCIRMEDGTERVFQWDDPELPDKWKKMRICMRTDGCSAILLWGFHNASVYGFANSVSLENFAYSLCRSSANVLIYYDCDWSQTPPEAQACFVKMLTAASMQCKIPPEGDHLFIYRHSKHPKITRETSIRTHRERRCSANGELLCTVTTYSIHTPYCIVFEHDDREKDANGRYKTELDQVYNRFNSDEIREKRIASVHLVLSDRYGKNEWIIEIAEFNNKVIHVLVKEAIRLGEPDHEEQEWRRHVRSQMEVFSDLSRDIPENALSHDIVFVRSKYLNMRIGPDSASHLGQYPATRRQLQDIWQYAEISDEMEHQNNGTMLHERTGFTILSHTGAILEVHEMAEELRRRRDRGEHREEEDEILRLTKSWNSKHREGAVTGQCPHKLDMVRIMHKWIWEMKLPEEDTAGFMGPRWEPKKNDFVYAMTGDYSGLYEEFQGQPAKILEEITQDERRSLGPDSTELTYSYYDPLTEQRVASSKAFLVKWQEPKLELLAKDASDSKYQHHKFLTLGQLLPHPRSRPDRRTIADLRAVARDPKARCNYDVSGARLPKSEFFRKYVSDHDKPDELGEVWNGNVLALRNAVHWANSKQRSFIHTVHQCVTCIHVTKHDMNTLLRKVRLETDQVKFLGTNLMRSTEDTLRLYQLLGVDKMAQKHVKVDFHQLLSCHPTGWHRTASTFLSAAMTMLQQMDRAIDKVERDPIGLVWKMVNIAKEWLVQYDMTIRFYSETDNIKKATEEIRAMMDRKEIERLRKKPRSGEQK